ncbi:hypothetical protein HPB48_000001 [Haemaphysalis longicornis]|uniref:Uncharacterized protein n=1 Tax=Haemaphysalis longicornis TaxID=44386 RepID=A0A9J6FKP3_HAELO|nr:hypothetical protein HPB48_000001 [Haemaphysalis longicornis]
MAHVTLRVSAVDARLCRLVARNVAQAVHQLCARCEQLACLEGSEALQVNGPATQAQQCNAALLHLLHCFQAQMDSSVEAVIQSIVQPLLAAVSQSVEAIILTMHEEDFNTPAVERMATPDAPCSLYMRELQQFLSHCQNDFFSAWPPAPAVTQGVRDLASRSLELLVRHASLVRPLSEGGKMRLAADFAQMEMALAPLGQPLADLGRPYKIKARNLTAYTRMCVQVLRALRPLLFQSPQHVAQSPMLGEVVPHSLVLHFLFAKAPPELRSPYEVRLFSARGDSRP